jgi:hypothetical protein
MKLSDFIMLSEDKKKFILLHQGVLIGKRKRSGSIIFLFHLQGFYVETYCNTTTKDVIHYTAFTHTKLLQPYLETIAIDDLFRE